jgi:uroporphyrinogen decarboxylase
LTKATIEYLSAQIDAGAEVVKIFDSWAGSLKGDDFIKYALEPTKTIVAELKAKYPMVPIIAFPRQAGDAYKGFLKSTGADCLAIDDSVGSAWAAKYLQMDGCIQGNLKSSHMVSGGQDMVDEINTIVSDLSQGPHIFNLGHGITPDANPENVALMIETIRNFKRS